MASAEVLRPRSSFDSLLSTATSATQKLSQYRRFQKTSRSNVWASPDSDFPTVLDARFLEVKKRLVKPENYEAVQDSWYRLLDALKRRADEIEKAGPEYVPRVDYSSIGTDGRFPADIAAKIKEKGCCVVRGVVSRDQALQWKQSLIDYCKHHPDVPGFPPESPQFFGTFWQKAQVEARSHPSMIRAQAAMSQLYTANPATEVDLTSLVVYADRFRVRQPGTSGFLPPHLDNGSIERWEDPEYSTVYRAIFEGRWEEYDAWDMDHRAEATIDLYGGSGSCSTFRSLQGWLSIADNGPRCGTIQFLPDIKLSTAYIMLRPFFNSDDKLDLSNTYFYGADPGQGQVVKTAWHPRLYLDKMIVSCPEAAPGDYVFWHCDTVHQVEAEHIGNNDSSVMYIPVVPLCGYNVGNMLAQRAAFLKGVPPPDLPVRLGQSTEENHEDRGRPADILSLQGQRMLGLAPFDEEDESLTEGQRSIRTIANEATSADP
ncbi:DUF1479-domain-containing protein [Fistulina hepatica ATCC 64428]|uniref:DUF1479-domain-containing protein n=1 Tax=Fistulina hepatica ATCC 64428 TaxID=1128425 RepID=A0A0D7AN22_9AGAR|nr:DUF1479-domain-containing protein [Fistulina hepatica ATCC 64428]